MMVLVVVVVVVVVACAIYVMNVRPGEPTGRYVVVCVLVCVFVFLCASCLWVNIIVTALQLIVEQCHNEYLAGIGRNYRYSCIFHPLLLLFFSTFSSSNNFMPITVNQYAHFRQPTMINKCRIARRRFSRVSNRSTSRITRCQKYPHDNTFA